MYFSSGQDKEPGAHSMRICLTPVKNEAWILRHFLAAASLWSDQIIIADQGSTDGSADIAREFSRTTVISNLSNKYNEAERQQLLLKAAREHPGPRILIPLDADEFLTPDTLNNQTIDRLLKAGPGTAVRSHWINIRPGLTRGWLAKRGLLTAWYDNGRNHLGSQIHSERLPTLTSDKTIQLTDGYGVMHWQYTAPERMRSKHRWYIAWERLNRPKRDYVNVYRQYHHMYSIHHSDACEIPPQWLLWYKARGVPLEDIKDDGDHWWTKDVLSFFIKYGTSYFSDCAIWDFDWQMAALKQGIPDPQRFRDPRNWRQKILQSWLLLTQRRSQTLPIRVMDRLIASMSPKASRMIKNLP